MFDGRLESASPGGNGSIEEAVLSALSDDRLDRRGDVVAQAARVLDPDALVDVMGDHENATRRNAAMEALALAGPRGIPALLRALEHPDLEVVMFATSILGKTRDADVVARLVKMLSHRDINVAQAAIDSLAQLRATAAVEPLLALLDRDPWLRFGAVQALGRIGDRRAVPGLLPLLEDEAVAEVVVDALGDIGGPEAAQRLAVLLWECRDREGFEARLCALGRALERDPSESGGLGVDGTQAPPAGQVSTRLLEVLAAPLAKGGASVECNARPAAIALVRALRIQALYGALVRAAADPDAWDMAVFSAACIGRDMEPALAGGLSADDAEARRFSCLCAGMLASSPLAPSLAVLLSDAAPAVRAAAVEALSRLNHAPSIPGIVRALEDPCEEVRAAAVLALSRMPTDPVTRALLAHAPRGGRALVGSLEVMRENPDPAQRRYIDACIAHDDPATRTAAALALAAQQAPPLIDTIAEMLADPSADVRREVVRTLGARRHPRARELLLQSLARDPEIRVDVVRALARSGDPGLAPTLLAQFPTSPPLARLTIIDAVGELRDPSAEPLLVASLRDPDVEVRRSAVAALGRFGSRTALNYLTTAAWDREWQVRAAAADVLSPNAGPAAAAALERLLLDPHPFVSARARQRFEEG